MVKTDARSTDDAAAPLAESASPFLRHGAEQPVEWRPWGAEAFEIAQRENRPILLDIGAVWCHWCHVMDHESYEERETADLINDLFIPVKVDRDERPDIDARYQRAIQALSGQGGWPLTAFLTPEGDAFYGGTYFPPDDRGGRPSFRKVLNEVSRVWREEPDKAALAAKQVDERVRKFAASEGQKGTLDASMVHDAAEAFADQFDFRHGGFGSSPKFPNVGAVRLLTDRAIESKEDWPERVVRETLDSMAAGGFHDQLGGGFHRYSVDARWIIPHFEKMAYDNGALLEAYSVAHAVWDDASHREVAEGIVAYYREVAPDLVERGGFPASQDADIDFEDDGDYWTWTLDEVRDALGGDEQLTEIARLRYGIDDPASSMPHGPERHVLFQRKSAEEVAATIDADAAEVARQLDHVDVALKDARDQRPRPYVDESVYAGWTGLVASGHIAATRFAGVEGAAGAACRALDRLLDASPAGEFGIPHRLGDEGAGHYLEDQAFVGAALLDAYELRQDDRYLNGARELADVLLEHYRASGGDTFTDRPQALGGAGLLEQPFRPIADSPVPSGNAVAALLLLRLAALLHEDAYEKAARDTLAAFAGAMPRLATSAATYVRAVDWATSPVTTVAVIGGEDDATRELWRVALSTYRPRTVVRRLAPDTVDPDRLPPALNAMLTGDAPRAYVCAGTRCAPPVEAPDSLRELLLQVEG